MIKLQCRKVASVLRLFTPTKDKNYGPNAHHLLILYYSFWKESDLKSGSQPSYANKLEKVATLQLVNENKQKVEPYIDEALIRHNIEVLQRVNQNIAGENKRPFLKSSHPP